MNRQTVANAVEAACNLLQYQLVNHDGTAYTNTYGYELAPPLRLTGNGSGSYACRTADQPGEIHAT